MQDVIILVASKLKINWSKLNKLVYYRTIITMQVVTIIVEWNPKLTTINKIIVRFA